MYDVNATLRHVGRQAKLAGARCKFALAVPRLNPINCPKGGHNMTDQRTKNARQFIEAIPHSRDLGMELTQIDAQGATITMPYLEKLIGDPATGVIHGGAISALMDTCAGAAVMSHPKAGYATATLDLRIDYMRSAVPHHTITARAECYHMTRSVAFVRATATDGTSDIPVATATGAFTVERTS